MQFTTAINAFEQMTRNSSKNIESIDRAMQSLSLRARQFTWVDPIRDVANRLLSVTTTMSAAVRQQKSQLDHLTAQLSQLSIDLASQ